MRYFINLTKYKWFIITICFVLFIIFILTIFNKQRSDNLPPINTPATSVTNKIASFGDIVPGTTIISEVNKLLGDPVGATTSGRLDVNSYKSENKYRNHKIYSDNGTAELIIEEIVDGEKSASDIQNTYGVAPFSLFEKSPSSTFKLNVYPKNGIAYLGHEDGTILEVWYFIPTSIEDFMAKWGKDYLEKESKEIPQY